MLKINNLNKYYNKGKSNEIHVIDNINYNNRIGIVAFGNEQITAGKISSNPKSALNDYKNNSLNFKKNATNFEDALIYSIDLLEDNSGRIIILTDGRQTDGNAIALAKQYSTKNIQIDAVYYDSTIKNLEVQINGIILYLTFFL